MDHWPLKRFTQLVLQAVRVEMGKTLVTTGNTRQA